LLVFAPALLVERQLTATSLKTKKSCGVFI